MNGIIKNVSIAQGIQVFVLLGNVVGYHYLFEFIVGSSRNPIVRVSADADIWCIEVNHMYVVVL